MDYVVPGGVVRNLGRHGCDDLAEQCDTLAREVRVLKDVYDDHAGLQDRFLTCGRLVPELAKQLGVVGLPARASAQMMDARVQPGWEPYDRLAVQTKTHANGDVAARVAVRFEELAESLRLIRAIAGGIRSARSPRRSTRLQAAAAALVGSKAGAAKCWWPSNAMALSSAAAMRTTRRGKTGRRSSMRSWATSFPTSR